MVEVVVRLNKREYEEASAARDGRTWRQVFLEALDVEEDLRHVGRPSRARRSGEES